MKASQTLSYVTRNIADITAEQIGKCHRVYDCQSGRWFYQVENSRDLTDEQGDLIEYEVRRDIIHDQYTCTCPSGQNGFANVTHPSGVCQHVRWAIAAAIEESVALAEQARKIDEDKVRHASELPIVKAEDPIEVRWNIPQWMLGKPVAPHMKKSPKER